MDGDVVQVTPAQTVYIDVGDPDGVKGLLRRKETSEAYPADGTLHGVFSVGDRQSQGVLVRSGVTIGPIPRVVLARKLAL